MQTSGIKHPCVVDYDEFLSIQKKITTYAQKIYDEADSIQNITIMRLAESTLEQAEKMYSEPTCCAGSKGRSELTIQWPCPASQVMTGQTNHCWNWITFLFRRKSPKQ